jgi:addiction module RelE/StbE family toxin
LKFEVSFSPHAKEDKIEAKNYLSKFYPTTPKRFTIALKKHISNLKENPYIYPVYTENPDYRRMVVDNYIVLYKISEKTNQIEISRILRASWDLPKYL